jgi:retron-type reverse transcriptase
LKSYSNRLVSVRRVTQINAGKQTPGMEKLVIKTPVARGRMVDVLAHSSPWKAKPVRRVYIPKANKRLRRLMQEEERLRQAMIWCQDDLNALQAQIEVIRLELSLLC